jgi:Icc protein
MSAFGSSHLSRRRFLEGLLGMGAWAATGIRLPASSPGAVSPAGSFRFAFLTDLHLMKDGELRSVQGIAACLTAVEALHPKPDFILVGGDLVNAARDLDIPEAERRMDLFLKTWNDNTGLPAHWTFGNHDLVATSRPNPPVTDPRYAKGMFHQRFNLPKLFYSFDHQGWHFVVLDDIALEPDHSYVGRLFDDELAFLQADLNAHAASPTIICTHIPLISSMPFSIELAQATGFHVKMPKNLVCTNANAAVADFPGHNIRAVLAGHLHRYEKLEMSGVPVYNSGAVCGNYWKGPMLDCPEGFGVVDLGADGSVKFEYRPYGWKA